jgi:hypothetical protein
MSATRHSIRSPVSCARVIRASSTRHIARHRPFKTAGVSHGALGRPASRRATQGWMSLSSEMERSLPFTSSSTRRLHSGGHRQYSPRPFPDRRARSVHRFEDPDEVSARQQGNAGTMLVLPAPHPGSSGAATRESYGGGHPRPPWSSVVREGGRRTERALNLSPAPGETSLH